jgi:hypothetical protein
MTWTPSILKTYIQVVEQAQSPEFKPQHYKKRPPCKGKHTLKNGIKIWKPHIWQMTHIRTI